MDTFTPQPVEQSSSKVWWVVIIVIVLVIAAFVFYYMRNGDLGPIPGVTTQSSDVTKLQKQGTGDDVASIEKDLQSTDLTNLNAEVPAITKELAAPASK